MSFEKIFAEYVGWSLTIASIFSVITYSTISYIRQERRDDLGLWMVGAVKHSDWRKQFYALFCAAFGKHHLSLRCFLSSSFVSVFGAALIYFFLHSYGVLSGRMSMEISFWRFMIIVAAINIIADYISLAESRYCIMYMPKTPLGQFFVIVGDFLLSALIVITVIWVFRNTPVRELEFVTWQGAINFLEGNGFWYNLQKSMREHVYVSWWDIFFEAFGFYSYFSIVFVTTFFTSVWIWLFVSTSSVVSMFSNKFIYWLFDPDERPGRFLSTFVFALSLLLLWPVQWLAQGVVGEIRRWDQALCQAAPSSACIRAAVLAQEVGEQNSFLSLACGPGVDYSAIRLEPAAINRVDVCYSIASQFGRAGLYRQQETILRTIYDLAPGQERIANDLAWRLLWDKPTTGDIRLANSALQPFLDSNNNGTMDTVALLYYRQGKFEKALKKQRELLQKVERKNWSESVREYKTREALYSLYAEGVESASDLYRIIIQKMESLHFLEKISIARALRVHKVCELYDETVVEIKNEYRKIIEDPDKYYYIDKRIFEPLFETSLNNELSLKCNKNTN
ncbi:hypothetical protein ABVF61_19125 [Roseibium sp. HPY-6]|uniref:hypothetical protein n=1 Tax=Roseibium sp. HPY-6 TaxID=3229852 RepID=UPI00338D9718